MSKESERKYLSSTPSITNQKRPGGSLETSVESSSGSDRSNSTLHSSIDSSFLSPLPLPLNSTSANFKKFDFQIPSNEVFDEMREFLNSFFNDHINQLIKLRSFYCTISIINDQNVILVGAECEPDNLKIMDKYKERVVVTKNKIRAAGRSKDLDITPKPLSVGSSIGVLEDNASIGTLGCFALIDNVMFGLTCFHVIPNGKQFQEPSSQDFLIIKNEANRRNISLSNQNYIAGNSNENGIINVINHSILDYQLLNLQRDVEKPFNSINYKNEEITLEGTVDLNDLVVAKSFIVNKQSFAKLGASSGFTNGFLYNSTRRDAFVKVGYHFQQIDFAKTIIQNQETLHKIEFSFVCTNSKLLNRFAETGDSGSIVYCRYGNFDTKIVGMVHAVCEEKPYFAYVTPITDIIYDFKNRTSKDIIFP